MEIPYGSLAMRCFAGIDDGFFKREWSKTLLVLAAHCFINSDELCPCFAAAETIEIDGMDVTEKAISLVTRARQQLGGLEAVLLDTVVFAGFNILDATRLYEETGTPVIVVYTYPPDEEAVEQALRKHFTDWRKRLALLRDTWGRLERIECSRGGLLLAPYGVSLEKAWRITCSLQAYTRYPEPLFTAHVLASNLSRRVLGSAD